MKQLLSLLLIWAFALTAPCALADTVAERTDAPERVTLLEARGGAQLVFDAPVQAPYGCRIPILAARSRKVSVEELQRALDYLLGEGNYVANINIYDATLEEAFGDYREKGNYSYAGFRRRDDEDWSLSPNGNGWIYDGPRGYGAPMYYNWSANRWRWEGKGLTCQKSEAEARALADEIVMQLAPEMSLAARIVFRPEIGQDLRLNDPIRYADELAYVFVYARPILSVPMLYEASGGMATNLENMEITVSGHGVEAVKYCNAMSLGDELEDDAALLPFEHVLERAKAEMAQRYANRRVEVERIAFGYAAVPTAMHDQNGFEMELQLVPAWAFYGNAYKPDEAYAMDWRPLVTVHAVSGMALNFSPYELR